MAPPLNRSISSVKRQLCYRKPICPFVSSTFQDFQVERDYLVKKVFPSLDDLCYERGTYFAPVDLRWGINDAQVSAGHVIRLCLDYIIKSAPFFICLLGERYGSHRPIDAKPLLSKFQDLPPDADWLDKNYMVAASAGYDWLLKEEYQSCSIVEIEVILAAFINNNQYCRFYFRQQDHVDDLFTDLPPHEREEKLQVYLSETDYAHQKVRDLKTCIAKKGLSIKYFRTPEELGRLVLEDWKEIIDLLYPPLEQLISETADGPIFLEWMGHEAFAETRRLVFVKTPQWDELFTKMSDFADTALTSSNEEDTAYKTVNKSSHSVERSVMVLVGERGCGKTTAIANWVKSYSRDLPDIPVIAHYVGSSSSSTDITTFMRRCIRELREHYMQPSGRCELELGGADVTSDKMSEYQHLCEMFTAAASLGPCILILDGIDEISGSYGLTPQQVKELSWLAHPLPPKCRMLISTAKNDISYKSLSQRKDCSITSIPVISDSTSKMQIITENLAMHCKCLSLSQLKRIVSCKLSDRPLFLVALANELRVFGVYSRLDYHLDSYLDAGSIRDLWSRIIQRWVRDYGWTTDFTWSEITAGTNAPQFEMSGWVADALRLIAVSRHGLRQSEILEILEQMGYTGEYKVSAFDWALFRSTALESLIERPGGLLNFFHHHLKEAVEYTLLGCVSAQNKEVSQGQEVVTQGQTDKRTFHYHLARYFAKHSTDKRMIDELPWQLQMSGSMEELCSLLSKPKIFLAFCNEKQNHNHRLDLINYWNHLTKAGYSASAIYCQMLKQAAGLPIDLDCSLSNITDVTDNNTKPVIPTITTTFASQLSLNEIQSPKTMAIIQCDADEKSEVYNQLELAQLCKTTGQFLAELGYFDQSEQVLLRAHEHLYQSYPLCNEEQQLLCGIEESIANLYLYQLKNDKAEKWYSGALTTISEQLQMCDDVDETLALEETKGRLLDHLGNMKTHALNFADAEDLLLDALDCMQSTGSITGKATVEYHIGVLRMKQKKHSKAEDCLRSALRVREQWYGKSHPLVAEILNDLAGLLSSSDNTISYDKYEAETLYRRALHIRETCFGQSHLLTATTLFHLGRLLKAKRSCTCMQEAVSMLRKSLDIRTSKLGSDHKITKAVRRCLKQVESALKLGQYDHGPAKLRDTRDDERPYSSLSWREPDLMKFDRIKTESNLKKRNKLKSIQLKNNALVLDERAYNPMGERIESRMSAGSESEIGDRPHTAHSTERRHLTHNEQNTQDRDRENLETDEFIFLENGTSMDNLTPDSESQHSEQSLTPSQDHNQESILASPNQQSHYIDSYAVSLSQRTFLTDANTNIRPHSAPIKMLKRYGNVAPTRMHSPTSSRFKLIHSKQRLNSAPPRGLQQQHTAVGSTVSMDSTIHRSKCYVPGPHSIDVNNAYSMRGPHTSIYSLLGSPPCPRKISNDIHHRSAWYHVPGRYPTIEKPYPAKRSQTRLPTKSRSKRSLVKSKTTISSDDSAYPHRTDTVVTFSEDVLHHNLNH